MTGTLAIHNYENTYYVDATSGSDSNDGKSTSTPWQTISKVNSQSFSPGDHILFKRGETWRERLNVPSSGNQLQPITFSDYGSGALPKILGSLAKNSTGDWTNESGNLWYTSSPTWHVHSCIFDNEASYSTQVLTKGELTTQGYLWWDDANSRVYLYSVGNPATVYNGVVECAQFLGGATTQGVISINIKNYITISNIDVRYCDSYGVHSRDSSHIKVDGCTIKYIGDNLSVTAGYGVYHWHSTINAGTDYIITNNTISYCNRATEFVVYDGSYLTFLVSGNTISYCILGTVGCGISFGSPTSTDVMHYMWSRVSNNTITYFVSAGIQMSHSSHVIIENNTIHDNYEVTGEEAQGISLGTYGTHVYVVRYNLIYNVAGDPAEWNDGCGIFTRNAYDALIYYNIIHDCTKGIYMGRVDVDTRGNDNHVVYNNVVYNCEKYGIWCQGINTGAGTKTVTIQNNICDCDHDSGDYDLVFEQDSSYDNINCTGGYNCLVNDSAVTKLADTTYSNTSEDLYATDPLFDNPGSNIFTLQAASPCIDEGLSVGLTRDYAGTSVPQGDAPDIGAYDRA
jgi:hypothetical protein